jgi:hypothetical protein
MEIGDQKPKIFFPLKLQHEINEVRIRFLDFDLMYLVLNNFNSQRHVLRHRAKPKEVRYHSDVDSFQKSGPHLLERNVSCVL